MRSFAHWTPAYVIDRLAILHFQRKRAEMVPLFAVGAIQFLERYLTKTDRVFEYGCGFSTVWLAKRVGAIISVDDDRIWYDRIRPLLPPGAELLFANSKNAEGNIALESDYIDTIKAYEPESFDLVIIDGQARAYTAVAALDRVKKGGILCWDDFGESSERTEADIVLQFVAAVKGWRRAFFDDGTHWTALYFKP